MARVLAIASLALAFTAAVAELQYRREPNDRPFGALSRLLEGDADDDEEVGALRAGPEGRSGLQLLVPLLVVDPKGEGDDSGQGLRGEPNSAAEPLVSWGLSPLSSLLKPKSEPEDAPNTKVQPPVGPKISKLLSILAAQSQAKAKPSRVVKEWPSSTLQHDYQGKEKPCLACVIAKLFQLPKGGAVGKSALREGDDSDEEGVNIVA